MASINIDLKASIDREFQRFISNNELSEYTFMSSFTAPERIYVHNKAKSLDLMSKSRGKGINRQVTIYKQNRSCIIQREASFQVSQHAHKVIASLLSQAPLTAKEKLDVTPHSERDRSAAPDLIQKETSRIGNVNRLVTGVPIVPSSRALGGQGAAHRHLLPIHALRDNIIQTINDNPVVVISGETGSGKTTQVPQYIMEHHERVGRACRIICAQPRRIAAVAMGERVAAERNCKVGTEVGYQIRHESVTNSRTVLTYITNGILLRTLMCGDSTLATVTHLIMDEIHIRDRVADFILVAVREALAKYRSLRLILISASVDTAVFSKYFNNCPVITVPGRLYEVKHYFLDDVLKLTNYSPKEMTKYREDYNKRLQQDKRAKEWTLEAKVNKTGNSSPPAKPQAKPQELAVDLFIENATRFGCAESLKQILHLVKNNKASVDHQHPSTRVTPLIAASIWGHTEIAEELLELGASLNLTVHKLTVCDIAREFNSQKILDVLNVYQCVNNVLGPDGDESLPVADDKAMLLESYKHCFNDTVVNADLILAIIDKIQSSNQLGAVLIFLPGYEDIVLVMDKLSKREMKPNESKLKLVALHSKMATCDQKVVFQPAPLGLRKVIVSTNLAESCITLADVVFVIDTGLVRESASVGVRGVGCRTVRCSKACVRQRRARAGRTQAGVCYHLFSTADYHAMDAQRTPEIKRTPLQNLCLQTKLLAQGNIADFIAKTLDPPTFSVVRAAVQLLKTIDALDPCEEVTLLGQHLIDLPLAPHLGKALIYGVLLKCLDPVLTIVAMLSYDDPFVTGAVPSVRCNVKAIRRRTGDPSQSDHCVLLVVFMRWLAARSKGSGRAYCLQNHLCEARLEMVHSHRQQLLTQLRSSGFVRNKDTGSDVRDLNQNSDKLSVVKAALTGGHYPNLVRVDRKFNALRTHDEVNVTLHPSSVLRGGAPLQKEIPSKLATDWIIYEEKSSRGEAGVCHVRVCSLVTDVTVALFAGPARFPSENLIDPEAADRGSDSGEDAVVNQRSATLKLDDWVAFRLEPYVARLVIMLRNKWHAVLAKRLRCPHKPLSTNDEAVIEALVAVLCSEEEAAGLQQPSGIGAKPMLISSNHENNNDFSPLWRRCSAIDISKQLAATDIAGNRHIHRRTFDMNDNASSTAAATNSCSNGSSLSPTLSSLSQSSGSGQYEPPQTNAAAAAGRTFFVVRYSNPRALERAYTTNVWHFPANTEMRLKSALREGKTVILLFSHQGNNNLQGYARLKGDHCEWDDVIFDQSAHNSPSAVALPIEWLKFGCVPANTLRHFCTVSDFNRLMSCRDGQEIDSNIGEALCLLWESPAPAPHMVFHPNGGHPRAIRAPQPPYYGNNSYGPPHGGNMRPQNM